jgi:hypothetical protein
LTTKNIKTASEVITEFLVSQAKDETLDADTVAAVSKLRKDDDLSKVKLLRKLEDTRKAALKADAAGAEEVSDD